MKKNKVISIVITIMMALAILFTMNPEVGAAKYSNEVMDQMANANLQSLTVEGYALSPEFNPYTTTYYIIVPEEVESLEVSAVPQMEKSTYKVTGNTWLGNGENIIKVTVTSEARRTNTYKIYVTKRGDRGLNLASLNMENITLTPEFTPGVYSYTGKIETFDLTPFKIDAIPANENATVEILGNSDIKEGKNPITIIVSDGENRNVYEIEVSLSKKFNSITQVAKPDAISEWAKSTWQTICNFFIFCKDWVIDFVNNNDNAMPVLAGVAAVVVLIFGLLVFKTVKKVKADKNREKIKKRAK